MDESEDEHHVDTSLDFFIVGSPRSGTTLVQRLLVECEGVSVPPETHFFSVFVPEEEWQFPLSTSSLRKHLETYADLDISPIARPDIDHIVRALGGTAANAFDLFAALVRCVTGDSAFVGEKTPHHLLWWQPLATAFPDSRIVWVVRDPRAVVESNLRMPWGMNSAVALAEMWRSDQRLLLAATAELGERLMVVKYEDVIADPEHIRSALAAHIGHEGTRRTDRLEIGEVAAADEFWKRDVVGEIRSDRVAHWKDELSEHAVGLINTTCRAEMKALEYETGQHSPSRRRVGELLVARRVRRLRTRRLRSIDQMARHQLGWLPPAQPLTDTSGPEGRRP